jgi:hypothetical protein
MAKYLFRIIFLLNLITICYEPLYGQQSCSKSIIWGINGHAVSGREPYQKDINQQLRHLKSIGFSHYRNDVFAELNGQVHDKARFEELLKQARQQSITVVPMLYDCWDPKLTTNENYQQGRQLGKNFTKKYSHLLSVIEIGNERDVAVFSPPRGSKGNIPADGQETAHYNKKDAVTLAACLDGMADGIHAVNGNIKVIISCSNHPRWGYFELLTALHVSFDIVGVHWYTSSGSILNIYGQNGLEMFAKLRKPIWITEINRGGGNYQETGPDTEAQALKDLVAEMCSNKLVNAFFVYELYDDPVAKKKGNREGFFGLYHNIDSMKHAASVMKELIKGRTNSP